MAYKYFTKQLLESNLDLNEVFHAKQNDARQQGGVSYGLLDIALFLKDKTSNFNVVDQTYVELDQVIEEIIARYYKSTGQENPFRGRIKIKQEFKPGVVPREATEVAPEGKVKGKGVVKPAPGEEEVSDYEEQVMEEQAEAQAEKAIESVDKVIEAEQKILASIDKLKRDLKNAQLFIEDEENDKEDKDQLVNKFKDKLQNTEDMIEMAENSEDLKYMTDTRDLLKEFIEKNTN
jgi:hypothetical protein